MTFPEDRKKASRITFNVRNENFEKVYKALKPDELERLKSGLVQDAKILLDIVRNLTKQEVYFEAKAKAMQAAQEAELRATSPKQIEAEEELLNKLRDA